MATSAFDRRAFLDALWQTALEAVNAETCTAAALRLHDGKLHVGSGSIPLPPRGRVFIAASGKAAAAMLRGARRALKGRVAGGVMAAPAGVFTGGTMLSVATSHPLPDAGSVRAATAMERLADSARPGDVVLALISGGTSAMLERPARNLMLEDIRRVHALLLDCGAPVEEVNTVRKALSRVKAGRLGGLLAKSGVSLATVFISDHVDDDPHVVGSGPTVPHLGLSARELAAEALAVLARHRLLAETPAHVVDFLTHGDIEPIPSYKALVHAAATSRMALKAAARLARKEGWHVRLVPKVKGGVEEASSRLAAMLKKTAAGRRPVLIAAGGETTVRVRGGGRGGRAHEMALRLAMNLEGLDGSFGLCAGTDGRDGSAPSAGAWFDATTMERLRLKGVDAGEILRRSDSYAAFQALGDEWKTGPMDTNVMDLYLLARRPAP